VRLAGESRVSEFFAKAGQGARLAKQVASKMVCVFIPIIEDDEFVEAAVRGRPEFQRSEQFKLPCFVVTLELHWRHE
jgi:hypothetical protein